MAEPTHSPYNFVPLTDIKPERAKYPGLDRIDKHSFSGSLTCELEVLTRLLTAGHQRAEPWAEGDERRLFPFLKDSNGDPILQATTLKGMIRAVFETAFPSCLSLAAARGSVKKGRDHIPYRMILPVDWDHQSCDHVDHLCPACRLFGITQGDEVHAQGRVFFSDARLTGGELQKEKIKLAELSTPKPYHYEFYSTEGKEGGVIRGRKLYYHHDPTKQPPVDILSPRASGISEFAPEGSRFTFKMRFENLSPTELKRLIACLILDDQHAHKLGMAKPLGYGSCRIRILQDESFVEEGGNRYRTFQAQKFNFDVAVWATQEAWLTGNLEEILRWPRMDIGLVGYLPYGGYRGKGIDKHGKYGPIQSGAPRTSPGEAPKDQGTIALFAGVPQLPAPQKPSPTKPRNRTTLEVTKYESGIYTLRDPETGQEDILFRGTGVPWRVGDPVKVRIQETTREGRIKKIEPG